jgi:photosystem II stability/assembly factor-like uncharacterized protein
MKLLAVRNLRVLVCFAALLAANWLVSIRASQPAQPLDPTFLEAFAARNIGPANMGGRVVQIAGVESDPKLIYVATGSGGLWKTTDGGDSWKPVFDHLSSVCIGDVAVSQSDPNVVWVGTGEHNARNSVAWGDGVYKSVDGGNTWAHVGLKDSHTIGRIAIHPKDPNIVYVAALGHLWGPNAERGIFKTTDGGKSWQVSKFLDENTGFIDLKMDPAEPEILYAAAYCVRRDGFSGGNPGTFIGPQAGLYKTSDGGKTWEKMTEGLPANQYGRCGIDIYRKDPNTVFAVVQTDKTKVDNANAGGPPNGDLGPENGGIFRSDDKGKTWKFVNTLCPRPFYFGQIRVDPNDDNRVYVLGVQVFVSDNGAKEFRGGKGGKGAAQKDPEKGKDKDKSDKGDKDKADQAKADKGKGGGGGGKGGPHSDLHALWINPKEPDHVWLGSDGGLYLSKDKAKSYQPIRAMAIGQFYGISVDMSKPYYVYGGLQDNGSWGGPSANQSAAGIRQNEWFTISGADGFHTASDPTDPNIVYTESQYGAAMRVNVANKGAKGGGGGGGKGGGKGGNSISVKGQGNRYNWSTPIAVSPHDPKTVYLGGNFLFMSTDRGSGMKKISPDLTYGPPGKAKNQGHTLFTIAESPTKKGVLWTGSDDGRIHVSKDAGENWTDVSSIPGMPKDSCISRVEPSHFADGTCYVSITRYRNDDRRPYIFRTTNYGESWQDISSNLPANGSVHVVIESSRNAKLLFAGTEFGVFVSLDAGCSWHAFKTGLPTVAVHDLVIHPRDRDLVIGTHGRSIWVIDNISPLEELTAEVAGSASHLFDVRPAVAFKKKPADDAVKANAFVGKNPPYGAILYTYIKDANVKGMSIAIEDSTGKRVAMLKGATTPGLHQRVWDLTDTKGELVQPGEYVAILQSGDGRQLRKKIVVEGE